MNRNRSTGEVGCEMVLPLESDVALLLTGQSTASSRRLLDLRGVYTR
jgi:hypothetical protein